MLGWNTYGMTKAAAWNLTDGLRLELAEQGTQVVALQIAAVDTDMAKHLTVEKSPVDVVVSQALDGIEAGAHEVVADRLTADLQAGLGLNAGERYTALLPQRGRRRPGHLGLGDGAGLLLLDHGGGLDLDEDVGFEEVVHTDQGGRRQGRGQGQFLGHALHAGHEGPDLLRLPLRDVEAELDDVGEARSGAAQREADVAQRLGDLTAEIAGGDAVALAVAGDLPSDVDLPGPGRDRDVVVGGRL